MMNGKARAHKDTSTPLWYATESGSAGGQSTYENSRSLAKQFAHSGVTSKIKKIMAANRGEIAIRICRAAYELGLRTVSIFSHEDRLSLHRYRADESYLVGEGKAPIAAYLDIDSIIQIALANHVDAIHPGYGFLAESSEFAQKVNDAGIIFVGPNPEVIERLGSKTSARQLAQAADVPFIPGSDGPCKTEQDVIDFAKRHGLPIILKAAYGGGGRGMRFVKT